VQLGAKLLGLLLELLPGATRFAAIVNQRNPSIAEPFIREMQTVGRTVRQRIDVLTASTNAEIDSAFAEVLRTRADATDRDHQ
jgi:hypothetical protein